MQKAETKPSKLHIESDMQNVADLCDKRSRPQKHARKPKRRARKIFSSVHSLAVGTLTIGCERRHP